MSGNNIHPETNRQCFPCLTAPLLPRAWTCECFVGFAGFARCFCPRLFYVHADIDNVVHVTFISFFMFDHQTVCRVHIHTHPHATNASAHLLANETHVDHDCIHPSFHFYVFSPHLFVYEPWEHLSSVVALDIYGNFAASVYNGINGGDKDGMLMVLVVMVVW